MHDIDLLGDVAVVLNQANGDWKLYGPFSSGRLARDWMDLQFDNGFGGHFGVVPLRTPDRDRPTSNDWWMDDLNQSREWLQSEFPNHDWDQIIVRYEARINAKKESE